MRTEKEESMAGETRHKQSETPTTIIVMCHRFVRLPEQVHSC